jgi:transcriptional regulator with XRE-family HTH domain
MSIGSYLKEIREERQLSLRDVERLAKEKQLGAELSSGYLSMLEQEKIKEPSPRILFVLSSIYEVDYIDLMKRIGYMPNDTKTESAKVAFRGASQLDKEQRERIQRLIDFELSESQGDKRKRKE